MPVARFQMPDGRIARFEVPDGTSPEQAQKMFNESLAARPREPTAEEPFMAEAKAGPGASMGVGQRFIAGMGGAVADIGRSIGQMTGSVSEQDVAEARKRDEGLGTAGSVGRFAGNVAAFVPTMMIPGANTLTGAGVAGGAMGLLTPTAEGESRGANVLLGAGGSVAGKAGLDKLASSIANRMTTANVQQGQNAIRDAALAAGRSEGYVVPPTEIANTAINRAAESVGGKAATAQMASARNQTVTNTLARKAIGIPSDTPLDDAVLSRVRANAGQAYEAIKQVPQTFKADQLFSRDVAKLSGDFAAAAREFPEIAGNESVRVLQDALQKPNMSPQAAVELIKKLRFDSSKNYKAIDDPAKAALAKAQRGAADAIEGMVERNLMASGNGQLIKRFRDARQLIARVHDVEAAMLPDGNVSARVLAKIGQDKPLTGELSTIAKFAGSFEKATQNPAQAQSAGVSNLMGMAGPGIGGALGSLFGGVPGGALGAMAPIVAPPIARSAILSPAYQAAMATPSYGPGILARIANDAANNKGAQALIPLLSSEGVLSGTR